jgi:hypothetical protein
VINLATGRWGRRDGVLGPRSIGSNRITMDSKFNARYGAGSYVLWQDRLYQVLYAIEREGCRPLLALRYAGAAPLGQGEEEEYEPTVSARQVRRSPWH